MKRLNPVALPEPELQSPLLAHARNVRVEDVEARFISQARLRIILGVVVFALCLAGLVSRLAEVSLFRAPHKLLALTDTQLKTRADIVDRNGELMVTSLKTYSLYANPKKVWDPVASTEAIISVLPHLDASVIEERLRSGRSFVWIARNLTPKQRQAVFMLGLPELKFQTEPKRVYPRQDLAAHVLGFTDIDQNGTAGAERAFNDRLSGDEGTPLALSIDMRVQFALTDELKAGVKKYQAKAASGVVLNIKTGEVLAMASLPDFDPNRIGAFPPESRLNRASMSLYELGSTFKPITMALALEEGVIKDGEKINVQNPLKVRDKIINDDHKSHVPLGIFDILAKSSNRGAAILAMRAGGAAQRDLLKRLGLFERPPIELKESARPLIAQEWQDLTTATVSYGHGISVTPLALASALGALLNDGKYVKPTLLKRPVGQAVEARQVITPQTSRTLSDMMRYVVTNGTGRNADIKGYGIMGKTGTAEKLVGGQYDHKRLVTSFVAAFPHRDPHYLVFVVFDEPKSYQGSYGYATAGWNAAKTAGLVVERIAPLLGLKREIGDIVLAKAGGAQ